MDLERQTRNIKDTFVSIGKGLFCKVPDRHVFESYLGDEIRNVLESYCAPGMKNEIYINPIFAENDGTPCLTIQFVPTGKLDEETLQALLQRVLIKFRRYLASKGLFWLNFGTYSQANGFVTFYIFYSEFETDQQKVINRYRESVRHKAGVDYGVFKDSDLEKELQDYENKDRL